MIDFIIIFYHPKPGLLVVKGKANPTDLAKGSSDLLFSPGVKVFRWGKAGKKWGKEDLFNINRFMSI